MRVLIACEYSGTVREAFRAAGHDAWSCDLLPTEKPGKHIRGDVLAVLGQKFSRLEIEGGAPQGLYEGWDMMIAHPPCTFLSYAGTAHWNKPGREALRLAAMEFFMALWIAPIPRIAIENPRGYPCKAFRAPDQVINPFYFGDAVRKRTCLWLKGLPLLVHIKYEDLWEETTHVPAPEPTFIEKNGKRRYFTDAFSFKKDPEERRKLRARFFPGIANAMASQWGSDNHSVQGELS